MQKKLIWILALIAIVIATGHTTVSAAGTPTASYTTDGGFGIVTVTAAPLSTFRVYGPRAGGVIGLCAIGVVGPLGTGSAIASVAPGFGEILGVHLNVQVTGSGGGTMLSIDDPGHEWWLD